MCKNIELALIGYAYPRSPKIIHSTEYADRQKLWVEGYLVDVIPESEAREIEFWQARQGEVSRNADAVMCAANIEERMEFRLIGSLA